MVRVIPPASTLYWPNTITVWSAPVPVHSIQPNYSLWEGYTSTTGWYQHAGSTTLTIFIARVITPGNYELHLEFCANLYGKLKILVNGQLTTEIAGEGTDKILNLVTKLNNLPGYSILEIQVHNPVYLRNMRLFGGRNALVIILKTLTLSYTTISPTETINISPEINTLIEMPPPTRAVSNVPTKLKGKFLII